MAGPAQDARYLAAARHAHTAGALRRAETLRQRTTRLDDDTRNQALSSRLHGLLLGYHDQAAALRLLADAAAAYAAEDDVDTARDCLVDAFDIVQLHLARPDPAIVARLAALAAVLTRAGSWADADLWLLRGTAICATEGFAAAAPLLWSALADLRDEVPRHTTPNRWY